MTHILSIWGWRNSCSEVALWSSVAVCFVHWCVHWEQWTVERHCYCGVSTESSELWSGTAVETPKLMAQTRKVTHTACCCCCVCVCACDTSVVTLPFATAVNKSHITNQNNVRIRRIIFTFLQKYLSHDRLGDCVMTQLSSQFQSFTISVCWPSSRHIYLRQIFDNDRRHYISVSRIWRWTWFNLH